MQREAAAGENYEYNTVEENIEIAKELEKAGVASLHLRLGPQEQHATQFLGDLYFDPRGYTVTLYEKNGSLGGMLDFAALIKGPHQNLGDYRDWSIGDLERKGVNVVTGQEVDAAFIKEKAPDAVILACGGKRDELGISGDDATKVISIGDAAMDMLPNKDMLDELTGITAFAVGDCNDPYNIQHAIADGNIAARSI